MEEWSKQNVASCQRWKEGLEVWKWTMEYSHLNTPEIDKLSDRIQYIKKYKTELNNLVKAAKGTSETCKADAMQLSRNLKYMVAQQTPSSGTGELTIEKNQKAREAGQLWRPLE
jgi:hypothetical protein